MTSAGEISERIARPEAGSGRAAWVRTDGIEHERDAGQRDIPAAEDAASLAVFLAGGESRTITEQWIVAGAGGCVLG